MDQASIRRRFDEVGRLLRTVRHLRVGQIGNRIVRRFASRPKGDGAAPPMRKTNARWRDCAGRTAGMVSPGHFDFIGLAGEATSAADWNKPGAPKLWLYNLHYFDDLRAEGADLRESWHRALLARWIAENPVGHGNGWEPYPASLRIVNWIGWALAGHALDARTLQSLAVQVRFLLATLEYHLLGNHLLANAKALVFAGCFFSGDEAETWLRKGLAILRSELREQMLGDGGHFELSPMYHSVILEDVLDLVQLAAIFPRQLQSEVPTLRDTAVRMLKWLGVMTFQDGEVARFNDAASGIARTRAELLAYADRLGIQAEDGIGPLHHLADSGYVRLQSGPWTAIVDVAEIGPSYLPGHGHADVLSLEVSLGGRRLLTNGGTSTYQPGPIREVERATASHATVEIDGENSSEIWSSFRVGRRAHPFDVLISEANNDLSVTASHDGYRWLPGKPVHTRRIALSGEGFVITDSVTGTGRHRVVGRLPLHPSVRAASDGPDSWRLEASDGCVVRVRCDGPAQPSMAESYYAPAFGRRLPRSTLVWSYDGDLPVTMTIRFEL